MRPCHHGMMRTAIAFLQAACALRTSIHAPLASKLLTPGVQGLHPGPASCLLQALHP